MPSKKPAMPPVKRKRARGKIQPPIQSWFQTDLQKARKKHPEFYLADFYYVNMLERNILTVQGETFGLHSQLLSKPLPPNTGSILAYLIVDALRGYAKSEWAWLNKDPGIFARAFQRVAQLALDTQSTLQDNGQLAKDLKGAARKVGIKWTKENAVEQAFLGARRRLIRDIRLLVDETFVLPKSKGTTITNQLCANLLNVFNIKTHKGQSLKQLHALVQKDRQRHEVSFMEADGMVRPSLQHKISILKNYPHGNVVFHPFPPSRPALPPYRISPMPQELIRTSHPYLNPADFNPSDLLNLF